MIQTFQTLLPQDQLLQLLPNWATQATLQRSGKCFFSLSGEAGAAELLPRPPCCPGVRRRAAFSSANDLLPANTKPSPLIISFCILLCFCACFCRAAPCAILSDAPSLVQETFEVELLHNQTYARDDVYDGMRCIIKEASFADDALDAWDMDLNKDRPRHAQRLCFTQPCKLSRSRDQIDAQTGHSTNSVMQFGTRQAQDLSSGSVCRHKAAQ